MSTVPGDPVTQVSGRLPSSLRAWVVGLLLVRGLLAVILGIILLSAPAVGGTVLALVIVITVGAWLMVDGLISIATGISERRHRVAGAGWTILGGVLALLTGLAALVFPLTTAAYGGLLLLWLAAIGLVLRGVAELLDRQLGGWVRLLGLLNVVFGIVLAVVLLSNPGAALLALVWLIAWYGILFGIAGIVGAVVVLRASRRPD